MRTPCTQASSILSLWRAAVDAFAAVIVVTGVTTHGLLHLACLIIGMLIGILILAVLKEPGDLVDTPPANHGSAISVPAATIAATAWATDSPRNTPLKSITYP